MELDWRNFEPEGNNLKWLSGWEEFQMKNCKSKTKYEAANRNHYDRIINALTDNKSVDVLNKDSTVALDKMTEKEYIIHYVKENHGNMTPEAMATGIAFSYPAHGSSLVSPSTEPSAHYRALMNHVINIISQIRNGMTEAEIMVAFDGYTSTMIATPEGVRATESRHSLDLPESVSRDEETGELATVVYSGTNSAPDRGSGRRAYMPRGFNNRPLSGSGEREFQNPMQFTIPSRLPPPIPQLTWTREALPSTSELTIANPTELYSSSGRSTQTNAPFYEPLNYRGEPYAVFGRSIGPNARLGPTSHDQGGSSTQTNVSHVHGDITRVTSLGNLRGAVGRPRGPTETTSGAVIHHPFEIRSNPLFE